MRGHVRMVEWEGATVSLRGLFHALACAGTCTVSYQVVCQRFRQGWSTADALTKPAQRRGRKKGASSGQPNDAT